jgi:excisionase family DNA binding protein
MSAEKECSAVEAARRLNVGLDYLYSLLWTGKLAGRKVNQRWRVLEESIQKRLKKAKETSLGTSGR